MTTNKELLKKKLELIEEMRRRQENKTPDANTLKLWFISCCAQNKALPIKDNFADQALCSFNDTIDDLLDNEELTHLFTQPDKQPKGE